MDWQSVIDRGGGVANTAKALRRSPQALYAWIAGTRTPDVASAARIERFMGGALTVSDVRPDVHWVRVSDPDWPHPAGRPLVDSTSEKESA